jgi:hypothetical protein
MKLSVTCLARTDMTPRAPKVAAPVVEARPATAARVITERPEMRSRFDSLFDMDDEELPTTLYTPSKSPRARRAVVAA